MNAHIRENSDKNRIRQGNYKAGRDVVIPPPPANDNIKYQYSQVHLTMQVATMSLLGMIAVGLFAVWLQLRIHDANVETIKTHTTSTANEERLFIYESLIKDHQYLGAELEPKK